MEQLVLFGAVGDLATRHTLPALAHLLADGSLPDGLQVLGVGREPLTDETYRSLATVRLEQHAAHLPDDVRRRLVTRLGYLQADLGQSPDLAPALHGRAVVAYLALPPAAYAPALRALRAAGVAPGSRLVVEKPFGQDAASARDLSRLVHTAFAERDVFRVDHFLYHQAVQDLVALRLATPLFEPLWDRDHVERVEITWEESAGVAGRADFYDGTGALRDMVQSHLLQLLALVAMDAPTSYDATGLRDAKAEVLGRVRAPTRDEVAAHTARGRYTAGTVDGQPRRGYLDEPGVDPGRATETYAYLELDVEGPRWQGVPFVLRTGKALGTARRSVRVHFRPAPRSVLGDGRSVLCVETGPDRMSLELQAAGPLGLPDVRALSLGTPRPRQALPASARLLRDVLLGDPTHTVRDDETEQSWRVVDAVLEGWRSGVPVLQDYAAGSAGPRVPASAWSVRGGRVVRGGS